MPRGLVEKEAAVDGQGPGAAARVGVGLEHGDRRAVLGCGERRGQSGETGTDHDDEAGLGGGHDASDRRFRFQTT